MIFLQLLEEEQNKLLNADGSYLSKGLLVDYALDEAIKEWWDQYIHHNPSVLTNVFYGSMLTTLRCNNCHHVEYVLVIYSVGITDNFIF